MKKKLVILGSTGSIGRSALDVVEKNQDRIEVVALAAHSNFELLLKQTIKFRPKYITLTDHKAYHRFKKIFDSSETELVESENGLKKLSTLPDADIVLNAVVGAAGLKASLDVVASGKRLALANKESMVIGGFLINAMATKTGAEILPVDSEHSAIWQALRSGKSSEVRKIILTASGGPFFDKPLSEFKSITKEQALNHPTWKMGPKITVDSATMINKGLEVIEAMHLFDISPDKIEVVIHPQSIIHSMVEFVDSSIIAQISKPDMRLPIADAFFYPERVTSDFGKINLTEVNQLTFRKPDFEKFPLLKLAWEVAAKGGTTAAVYNAANEIAVQAFLDNTVEFVQIPDMVINCVEKHRPIKKPSVAEIIEADRWARETAGKNKGIKC
jgi:1-deoxy-D-xylulose-5-phosphate reductoisomerase